MILKNNLYIKLDITLIKYFETVLTRLTKNIFSLLLVT